MDFALVALLSPSACCQQPYWQRATVQACVRMSGRGVPLAGRSRSRDGALRTTPSVLRST
eukprot:15111370-Alexandrium_andersonii.AAC.1